MEYNNWDTEDPASAEVGSLFLCKLRLIRDVRLRYCPPKDTLLNTYFQSLWCLLVRRSVLFIFDTLVC